MCEYCQAEGCDHNVGRWHNSACKCSLTGPSKCEECGCDCSPWYQGLEIPGKQDLYYALMDLAEGNRYPLTRGVLVARLRENGSRDADWLSENLAEGSYGDPGEVMVALTPSFESQASGTMLTTTQVRSVASGTRVLVREGEAVVMLSRNDNSACDVLPSGNHVLSVGSCPLLAAKSRMTAPGFDKMVLNGHPLFVSLKKEIQVPFMIMGQSASGKAAGAKGTVEITVQSSKELAQFAVSSLKNGLDDSSLTSLLTNRFNSVLRAAILSAKTEELKANHGLLENPIAQSAAEIGLKANVRVEYAGEPTPDLAMGMMSQTMGDIAAKMAMAQQAMKAAGMGQQMRGMGGPVPGAQQPMPPSYQSPSPQQTGTKCPNCGFANPPGMKFCNNCGSSLGPRKCPSCGADVRPEVKFCGSCGAKL